MVWVELGSASGVVRVYEPSWAAVKRPMSRPSWLPKLYVSVMSLPETGRIWWSASVTSMVPTSEAGPGSRLAPGYSA